MKQDSSQAQTLFLAVQKKRKSAHKQTKQGENNGCKLPNVFVFRRNKKFNMTGIVIQHDRNSTSRKYI
jgi:hypothetical protein